MRRFNLWNLLAVVCLVGLLAEMCFSPGVAAGTFDEDFAAVRALKTSGYNGGDCGPAVAAKATELLAAHTDLTQGQKNEVYNFVGWSYWEGTGNKSRGVEWYGRILTETSSTSTATSDIYLRRNARFFQGICTGEGGDRSAGVAIIADAFGMTKGASQSVMERADWDIAWWWGLEASGGSWNNTTGANILYENLIGNSRFTSHSADFPWTECLIKILRGKYWTLNGGWNVAAANAFLAAHPFNNEVGTGELSVLAELKQAAGDVPGAKAAFLDVFKALRDGNGGPDDCIGAVKAMKGEELFADAAEQTAYYQLILRIVPATEGNAKFLGLVKSQIEALK